VGSLYSWSIMSLYLVFNWGRLSFIEGVSIEFSTVQGSGSMWNCLMYWKLGNYTRRKHKNNEREQHVSFKRTLIDTPNWTISLYKSCFTRGLEQSEGMSCLAIPFAFAQGTRVSTSGTMMATK